MASSDDSSSGATGNVGSGSGGGIMQGLSGLLKSVDPQFLMSMGIGLMSGARYGSNAGQGLMQGLQMYQGMKSNQLQNQLTQQQIQSGALNLQQQQAWSQAATAAAQRLRDKTAGGGQPAGSASNSPPMNTFSLSSASAELPFYPGISVMPNGAPPAGPTSASSAIPQSGTLPAGLMPPSPQQIYGTTYPGGMDPTLAQMAAYRPGVADPNAVIAKFREDQLKAAQQQYAPLMAKLDTVVHSQNPSRTIQSSSDLMNAWPVLAKELNFDTIKDFNDTNVRFAMNHLSNLWAASLSEPTHSSEVPVQKVRLPDGRTAQVDPVTGKQTIEAPSPMEKVIGSNGQPTLVPTGLSGGMMPFSPPLMGTANMTDQSREMAYQYYLQHQALPPGTSKNPTMSADMMNYIARRAQQDGNTQASILANAQVAKNTQGVIKDFTSGATSKTLNGLNTAISHMDQLDQAATALGNGNIQAFNKLGNFFGTQFGSSTTTNFNVVKNFAAGEVAKAVLPGGGGEREREDIAEAIRSSNSPTQLHDAIQTWRNLLAGKTDALRNQWDVGTNGAQGSFDRFLLPATKKALGIDTTTTQPTAATGGGGKRLVYDPATGTFK